MTILDINNNSFYNKFDYNVEKAIEALKKEFGQQFSISKSVREQHTSTTTVHTPEIPDGVVEIEIDSDTKQLPTSRTKNLEKESLKIECLQL